jgi:tetratricopeptide (TPR) repeat protein
LCAESLDEQQPPPGLGLQPGVLAYHRLAATAALDSLGYAHQHLGHHAEVISCYQQALDLHLEISGNWGAAETLGHLGDARYAVGDLAGARADWEESLVILDDLDHPDANQIRAKLSEL